MTLTRRRFLKLTVATTATMAFGGLGFSLAEAEDVAEVAKLRETKLTTSICCYCAVGCGLLVHTAAGGKTPVNVEGDPDHPINEGSLCPKGAALRQLAHNDARPPRPLYRAPGSAKWEEKDWDWTLREIAKRVKKTRDETFMLKNDRGETVNRTESIVSFGSAALDNEECWTYQAFLRSLGLVNIEHQARI